ncbi:MAG: OmpA family protein [Planctomycetota bacterium]|nr:OmpA family protein [Planctomycetota bacterium]
MAQTRWIGLAVSLILLAGSAVGCCEQEKKQLAALQSQYNDLSAQNKDLRSQLSQARAGEADMLAKLDAKDVELASAKQKLQDALSKASTSEEAPRGWEKGLTADKITVGSDVLFASGKAVLTAAGKRTLDKVAADLKGSYVGLPVRVYGYADTDPIKKSKWKDNLELSANRAMAVTRYLVRKGIKAKSVETVGMGEHHPVAGSKAKSRRVEIVVIK